ncbi:MAG: 6-bladed beta-propeller [Candidatus Aminicenantes bacterium]|nr:6-bladed beta-propeller [Candidatus Aminicenantes bacterium]
MKKTILPALCFVLFSGLLFFGCNSEKSGWQGSIEVVDGVTVVQNPKEPLHAETPLTLEEELAIGGNTDAPNEMFAQIRHIAVGDNNELYILDNKENHIKCFDENGSYIRTIGKKGKGPGEFDNPSFIYFKSGELMVSEFDRATFFSPEGDLLRIIPTSKERVLRAQCNSQGNIAGFILQFEPKQTNYILKLFDASYTPLKELYKIEEVRKTGVIELFSPIFYLAFDPQDNLAFSYPDKGYELLIFNPQGDLFKKIRRDYDPVNITEEEKKEASEGFPDRYEVRCPQHHPPFMRFLFNEKGYLFVQTYQRGEGENVYIHDIFSPEGRYLARMPIKRVPVLFKSNKLYSLEEDEDGYITVKRYAVTWQIKS